MKNAKPTYLASNEMEFMSNTDAGDILNSDNPIKLAKQRAGKYGKSEKDTGSTEGQIALFSHRIDHLSNHLKKNKCSSVHPRC